ncbi:MAG: heparin lyase I family protein [Chitinophagaceae bacterium]|nr:heparin lyase I family protein [Chitinophagaceae bacterium]
MKNLKRPLEGKLRVALPAGAILLSSLFVAGCQKDISTEELASASQDAIAAESTTTAAARTAGDVSIFATDTKTGIKKTTHSLVNVPAGALLVLTTSCESSSKDATITSTPSMTWTKKVQAHKSLSGDAEIFTATYAAGGSITINSTWPDGEMSSVAYVIINQEATDGGAFKAATLQTSPSVPANTTKENSLLICVTSDWKAIDGTKREYRDNATEVLYANGSRTYSTYHYYKDAGAITTYREGLTLPTGQSAGTCVLEVRGKDKSTTVTTPPATTPTNLSPVINTMTAQTITLPLNSITLTGVASDPDGTIVSYLWTKVSGSGGTITTPASAITTVTGLTTGSYAFNLKVTDNSGATANQTASVTVNPATTTPSTSYGTLVFQTGYDDASAINTNQGPYNTISYTIFKTGPGSFRSEVRQNQPQTSSGYRSEMSYSSLDPAEGVYEYDVYYENWKSFEGGGHSIQWHPNSGTGSAVLSLQNYGGKFDVVRSINGNNMHQSGTLKTVTPNVWYHMRWEIKWSTGSDGYVRLYMDDVLYYSYTGVTADATGTPYWKVGQNRWFYSGSGIAETSVVYYDNVKIYKK